MVYTKIVTYIYIYYIYMLVFTCISFCSPLRENDSHFDSFFADRCDSTNHLSSLEVDAELGAGFDAHATWYGMVIEEIDDEPGQDENLQPGPMVRPQKIDTGYSS